MTFALEHWSAFDSEEEFAEERRKLTATWAAINAEAEGDPDWVWVIPRALMLENHRAILTALVAAEGLWRVRSRQAARKKPPCCGSSASGICPQHAGSHGYAGPRKRGLKGGAAIGYREDEIRRARGSRGSGRGKGTER